MDWGLFTIGLVPFASWLVAITWALRRRLFFTATIFSFAAFTGLVFSAIAAGDAVPSWLVTVATLLRVPTVVGIIVAFIYAWHGVRFADVIYWMREQMRPRQ